MPKTKSTNSKKEVKKENVSVLDFYLDPKQHCITRKWYCRFMPWLKHGEWKMVAKIVSLDELTNDDKKTQSIH